MRKETVEGSTVYFNLLTDNKGWQWSLTVRADGSVSVWCQQSNFVSAGHVVHWDSLDGAPPTARGLEIMQKLGQMAEGIVMMLVKSQEVASAYNDHQRRH